MYYDAFHDAFREASRLRHRGITMYKWCAEGVQYGVQGDIWGMWALVEQVQSIPDPLHHGVYTDPNASRDGVHQTMYHPSRETT